MLRVGRVHRHRRATGRQVGAFEDQRPAPAAVFRLPHAARGGADQQSDLAVLLLTAGDRRDTPDMVAEPMLRTPSPETAALSKLCAAAGLTNSAAADASRIFRTMITSPSAA